MSKRTLGGKSKGKRKSTIGDEPEGQPHIRPRLHPVARPPVNIANLASRPGDVGVGRGVGAGRGVCRGVGASRGVGAGRGVGRGGNRSVDDGNGDRFTDEQEDLSEYIDEGNRHAVRPRGIHSGRGVGNGRCVARGGSSSAVGNGDRFAGDRGDIGGHIDEGNRHTVRPRGIHGGIGVDGGRCVGRGGSSSAAGNGDRFADDRGDIGEYIDEGNRHTIRPRGIHGGRGGRSSSIGDGDRVADDYMEDFDEGMDELDTESSQRRRGSNIADTPPTESSQRSWIYPYQNGFTEPRVHRQITSILKYSFDGPWAAWKEVPKRDVKLMWERFQELYQWDARVKALVEKNFIDYMSKRFSDVMRECRLEAARRANEAGTPLVDQDFTILKPYPPVWIEPEYWCDMIDRVWNTAAWKKKSKAGRENRSTLIEGQVSKHTAGSIRIDQHRLRMEKERGGPVSSLEVYQRCHTKKGTFSEYITTKAKNVADKYSGLMEEKYGEDLERHPEVGDKDIWEQACGGLYKKGRFFGFGAPMDLDLALTGTPSTPSTGNSSVASSEEVENLKDQLAEQEKVAQERERVAQELQHAAEERERIAEQRVKELEDQVKDIAEMLKTLKPPPSSPPS